MKENMKFENGAIINFDKRKTFRYVKKLGEGGTGDTHLLRDDMTDMVFAFKKYVPKDERYMEEFYKRFVDEIKILFKISHPNIVRIYNTYLYPEQNTGYLQMEYIEGTSIDKYIPFPWGKSWNEIFVDTINAFVYLEKNNILHRDVRPQNIMVDKDGIVKIIDFGFGKILANREVNENSIFLNWPVTENPKEIELERKYDVVTEIYFVGKLFEKLLKAKNAIDEFNYNYILEKMTEFEPEKRYQSFQKIYSDITEGIFSEIDFNEQEKEIYIKFADELSNHVSKFYEKYVPVDNSHTIINNLANVIKNNSLEKYIQNNSDLINCFVENNYSYNTCCNIEVLYVKKFYKFLINLPKNKQKNVIDNINTRLSKIRVERTDDLPF